MNRPDCLYIVIPCYNEEQVLPVTSGMFLDELNHLIKAGKISSDSKMCIRDRCNLLFKFNHHKILF